MTTKRRTRSLKDLPQLGDTLFLSDGGIETCLIFHDGFDLPHFASFDLMKTDAGRAALGEYYERYIKIAERDRRGFILESPTWRASSDWGRKLGYSPADVDAVNRDAIYFMRSIRNAHAESRIPILISGCVGPRGDGYDPGAIMTTQDAEAYHSRQCEAFTKAGADLISAITMTNVPEAIGIARAADAVDMPVVIAFTTETDGHLPTGHSLGAAIEAVDAATDGAPAYYMVNCAHPSHFAEVLEPSQPWTKRIRGVRANASRMSHAELDNAEQLDDGDPQDFGREYRALRAKLPHLTVLGGCCGTDHRHIACVSAAL